MRNRGFPSENMAELTLSLSLVGSSSQMENRNLASGRGGAFFLTSLFIELIDQVLSEKALLTTVNHPRK